MIFLTCLLCTVMTTAQYVECYNNTDCWKYHEKKYCYVGMCTDNCPPGYAQQNEGSEPWFTCKCNSSLGFKEDDIFRVFEGHNFTDLAIPKCKCDRRFCVATVYATGIGYTDGLIPKGEPPNCKADPDRIPSVHSLFMFYLVIGTMIVFLFVNCRSSSHVIYDFYRYYAIYILASIAVIVFVQTVYPFSAGFTRTMAFGIMIHNSSEWNLLIRLQYGKTAYPRVGANLCVMVYYVIMLVMMAILPLDALLLFSMIQGGLLDWSLLFFVFVAAKLVKDDENPQPCLRKCCCCRTMRSSFICGFGFGALTHLVSVEILFVGFAMNSPGVIGAGAALLVPTFLIYTFWVIGQDLSLFMCGPVLFMNYENRVGETPSFKLVPFMHTTQLVDLCWQRFIGNRYDENEHESELRVLVNGEEVAQPAHAIEKAKEGVQIEDPESFKFGIEENDCCCGGLLFSWLPIYWLVALAVVTVNACLIMFTPKSTKFEGCAAGYKYGAW